MADLCFLKFSSSVCPAIYAAIISVLTFPVLPANYPLAHILWPQYVLCKLVNSRCSLYELFPFSLCTSLLTAN